MKMSKGHTMQAAIKAKAALEALEVHAQWDHERRLVLGLVLEHLIQSAGDRKAQSELRRRVDRLESEYGKVVAEADHDAVVPIDVSPGLSERYGVSN